MEQIKHLEEVLEENLELMESFKYKIDKMNAKLTNIIMGVSMLAVVVLFIALRIYV